MGEWHRWNRSGFLTTGTGSGLSRSYWTGWSTGLLPVCRYIAGLPVYYRSAGILLVYRPITGLTYFPVLLLFFYCTVIFHGKLLIECFQRSSEFPGIPRSKIWT